MLHTYNASYRFDSRIEGGKHKEGATDKQHDGTTNYEIIQVGTIQANYSRKDRDILLDVQNCQYYRVFCVTYFLFRKSILKRRQIIAQTMPQMFRKENTTAMGTKIVTNSSLGDPSYGIKPIILSLSA